MSYSRERSSCELWWYMPAVWLQLSMIIVFAFVQLQLFKDFACLRQFYTVQIFPFCSFFIFFFYFLPCDMKKKPSFFLWYDVHTTCSQRWCRKQKEARIPFETWLVFILFLEFKSVIRSVYQIRSKWFSDNSYLRSSYSLISKSGLSSYSSEFAFGSAAQMCICFEKKAWLLALTNKSNIFCSSGLVWVLFVLKQSRTWVQEAVVAGGCYVSLSCPSQMHLLW